MKNKILIIDIETSGFLRGTPPGEVVEVGIVELDINTGDTKILYNRIVREANADALTGSEWIFQNSTLNLLDVLVAPKLEDEKAEIQDIINKYAEGGITAYNNVFDFEFLEDRGFVFPTKLACPMKLLTPILKIPAKGGRKGYKWPSVTEAYIKIFKLKEYKEHHRGGQDALDEAHIVFEMIKTGHFPFA
jgi:hypothetical protein